MNFLQGALRRPFTVVVAVIAVVLAAFLAIQRMSRDIFPPLGVPTIYVAQPYGGMDPAQMEGYLTYRYEYHFLYIAGISHVESKSIQGASIMKLQFHPGTDMSQAMSETIAQVNRSRAFMPPGTVAPFVMRFDAGSVWWAISFSRVTTPTARWAKCRTRRSTASVRPSRRFPAFPPRRPSAAVPAVSSST